MRDDELAVLSQGILDAFEFTARHDEVHVVRQRDVILTVRDDDVRRLLLADEHLVSPEEAGARHAEVPR